MTAITMRRQRGRSPGERRPRTRLPALQAAGAAIAELGAPASVAAAFAGELATSQARRTLIAFLVTGPMVGVWWLLLLVPHAWPPDAALVWGTIPVLPLIGMAVAAVSARWRLPDH